MGMSMENGVLSFMEKDRRPIKAIVLGTNVDVCTKKKLTQSQAEELIMKRWANFQDKKGEKHYYYCLPCDAFHTTSL